MRQDALSKFLEIGCCEIASEAILGQKQSGSSYMAHGVLLPILGCSCRAQHFFYARINAHMSMFANNALLGGGVRVRVWIRKIKGNTKPLMANLDITLLTHAYFYRNGIYTAYSCILRWSSMNKPTYRIAGNFRIVQIFAYFECSLRIRK